MLLSPFSQVPCEPFPLKIWAFFYSGNFLTELNVSFAVLFCFPPPFQSFCRCPPLGCDPIFPQCPLLVLFEFILLGCSVIDSLLLR